MEINTAEGIGTSPLMDKLDCAGPAVPGRPLCSKCILPSTTPGIVFDSDGVCNYCQSYEPMQADGEHVLETLLSSVREASKGKKYDCMVGLSGGRDSTFTLWKLVHDYQLRVLAVHYNNPFSSPHALRNIERACEILNVDKISWEFPGDEHRKSTAKLTGHEGPPLCSFPSFVPTVKPGGRISSRLPAPMDVSLVVIGGNPLETASFKKAGFGDARSYHKIRNIPKIVKGIMRELAGNPAYLKLSWPVVGRMYLGASHSTPYMRLRYRDINVIRLFDYLKWDEAEIEKTISDNLGWTKSPEVASSWRFDCRLDYVRRFMYAATVGVTELETFSAR